MLADTERDGHRDDEEGEADHKECRSGHMDQRHRLSGAAHFTRFHNHLLSKRMRDSPRSLSISLFITVVHISCAYLCVRAHTPSINFL